MASNNIRHIVGLKPAPGLAKDPLFLLLWLAGLPFAFALALTGWGYLPGDDRFFLYVSMILWFPLTEELAFRGLVQGLVCRKAWGRVSWQGVSRANLVATTAFVLWHCVYHVSPFVLVLVIPSLIFGFFRDRYDSLIPALLLHVAYNGFLVVAVESTG